MTMGSFDVLHAGHLFLFEQCRKIASDGGTVIVTANSDEFIKSYKGIEPAVPLHERLHTLRSLRTVDKAIENYGNEEASRVIDDLRPDFLIIGDDWAKKDYYAQISVTQDWLNDRNISLLYVPRVNELSSSALKKKIANL